MRALVLALLLLLLLLAHSHAQTLTQSAPLTPTTHSVALFIPSSESLSSPSVNNTWTGLTRAAAALQESSSWTVNVSAQVWTAGASDSATLARVETLTQGGVDHFVFFGQPLADVAFTAAWTYVNSAPNVTVATLNLRLSNTSIPDNLFAYEFENRDGGYLAGFEATCDATMDNTTLAVIGTQPSDALVRQFVSAFLVGNDLARDFSTCSNARAIARYSYSTTTGSGTTLGTSVVNTDGADVVFVAGGDAPHTAMVAAAKTAGAEVIAVDTSKQGRAWITRDYYTVFLNHLTQRTAASPQPSNQAITVFGVADTGGIDIECEGACHPTTIQTARRALELGIESGFTVSAEGFISPESLRSDQPDNVFAALDAYGDTVGSVLFASGLHFLVDLSAGAVLPASASSVQTQADGDMAEHFVMFGGVELSASTGQTNFSTEALAGSSRSDLVATDQFATLDVRSDTWTVSSPTGTPSARSGHSMALLQSTDGTPEYVGWLWGGQLADRSFVDELHVYFPRVSAVPDQWSSFALGAGGPQARAFHSAAAAPSWIDASLAIVFGGETTNGTVLGDLWEFRLGSSGNGFTDSTWTEVSENATGTLPPALTRHASAVIDGTMYVFGGFTSYSSIGVPSSALYAYNISGRSWSKLASSDFGLADVSMTVAEVCPSGTAYANVACHDGLYVTGGRGANGLSTLRVSVFSPVLNEWFSQDNGLSASVLQCATRSGHQSFVRVFSVDGSATPADDTSVLASDSIASEDVVYVASGEYFGSSSSSSCAISAEPVAAASLVEQASLDDNPCAVVVGQHDVDETVAGWFVVIWVGGGLIVLAVLVARTAFLLNKWHKIAYEKVPLYKHTTFKRSPADRLRQITLITDTFQIMAICLTANYAFNYWGTGPDETAGVEFRLEQTEFPKSIRMLFKSAWGAFLFDVDEVGFWTGITYNRVFFFFVFVSFGFAAFYSLLVAAIYYESEDRLLKYKWGRKIVRSLAFVGPFCGNIVFIPVVYNLLSVFACTKASTFFSDGATHDAFMSRDCTEECWEPQHWFWVFWAVSALAVYVPAAIYTRPVWQMLHDTLTLKDQPAFTIVYIVWKLLLCIVHAFFEQYPLWHGGMLFILTLSMLLIVIIWRPTTLPYFDLHLIVSQALIFWTSAVIVAGIFIRTWVTMILISCGLGLILIEYVWLSMSKLGSNNGTWAKGTIAYQKRQEKLKRRRRRRRVEKRRRLLQVANYNNAIYMADNPRDVPPLDPSVRYGADLSSSEDEYDPQETRQLTYRNRETGELVKVLKIANTHRSQDDRAVKVLGLQLTTPVPSQTPMSVHLRKDNTGTLVVMRSPETTLYKYLKMKINAYHAYYTAYDQAPAVERPKEEPKTVGADRPYLSRVRGPAVNIMPHVEVKEERPTDEYRAVNNHKLVNIVQNTGTDPRSFQLNSRFHAAALSEYVQLYSYTNEQLGQKLLNLFGAQPYAPEEVRRLPDKKTRALQAKIDEVKQGLENLDETLHQRMHEVEEREFERGRREAQSERA